MIYMYMHLHIYMHLKQCTSFRQYIPKLCSCSQFIVFYSGFVLFDFNDNLEVYIVDTIVLTQLS